MYHQTWNMNSHTVAILIYYISHIYSNSNKYYYHLYVKDSDIHPSKHDWLLSNVSLKSAPMMQKAVVCLCLPRALVMYLHHVLWTCCHCCYSVYILQSECVGLICANKPRWVASPPNALINAVVWQTSVYVNICAFTSLSQGEVARASKQHTAAAG